MQEVYYFINNIGFPIVCCLFMFKQNQTLTQSIASLTVTLNNIDKRLENLERVVKEHDKGQQDH